MSKILIVDDSDIDRLMLSRVLKKRDHDVATLSSGEKIFECIEGEKPDLIILDILMPGIQGGQILHSIRAKYSAVQLPVIMVTSKTDASDVVEFLYLGANDYIKKPVDLEVALMRISTHLKISELSREGGRLRELEAINALVTTYNHEINNPLAIALGALKNLQESYSAEKDFQRMEKALWRIADIVKMISGAAQDHEVKFKEYGSDSKMVKLK